MIFRIKITLVALILSWLLLFTSGCTTKNKFIKYGTNHKDIASELCSELFPLKPSSVVTKKDTVYAENTDYTKVIDSLLKVSENASNAVKTDTIYSEIECNDKLQSQQRTINSLISSLSKLQSDYKPCEPTIITNTIETTIPDSALVYRLQNELKMKDLELAKKEEKIDSLTTQRNWLGVAVFILLGVQLVRWFIKR